MKNAGWKIWAAAVLLGLAACTSGAGGGNKPISLLPAFSGEDLAAKLGSYYAPVRSDVQPSVPAYNLPLAPADIQNLDDVLAKIGLAVPARDKLLQNGFATVSFGSLDDIVAAYDRIKELEMPVFVTTDSVLHLYHIQFDETLRVIEEKEFYPDLTALTRVFRAEMEKRYGASKGLEKTAYKKGLAYFAVAEKLLDPEARVPASVQDWVDTELGYIEKHGGFEDSPIFTYREDYSQYVPRGHYTRSEELKRYFKAMMWYGRLTMLIKGSDESGPDAHFDALVSKEEAQAQTMLGAAIASLFGELQVGDRSAAQVWERIYAVTAYYVGLADDLTPQDYVKALGEVFGDKFEPGALADPAVFGKFQDRIARLKPPAIYSGTGESGVNMDLQPDRALSPEQLDRILGKTMGFRMMGQRYIPDSYILGQLVAPVVGSGLGAPAFTTVMIPDFGPIRGFPRGLDVMAVLGSDRALAVMDSLGDTNYAKYQDQMKKLRDEFGKISVSDWNRNLYWSWLYALKGLTEPTRGPGWPTFMTTDTWADKQLNAALGSWSSLRHDTILYAKQSYTPTITAESAPPPRPSPKPVVGYVEPAPEFYARLVALTRMSEKGLKEMKVLDDESLGRLQSLGAILARLQALSEKELKNEELTEEDYAFIRNFGERLSAVVSGASEAGQKTTLIADVHTDQNTGQVLEEGTGYLRLMLVAYKLPQGHVLVGAGPVFSYYEFKHPMSDRLTDEKWRTMLQGRDQPRLPEWTGSFAAE
ncbi:MAG TPA: DUF3160 domain-containing protein [bacterium]|nr:DUF3160 domain-containing protein [bacterium]